MAFKDYYRLTKPGIVYGNTLTGAAGFLLASRNGVDWWLLLAVLSGLALTVASACVFNNYIDQGIDTKMERTRKRALVAGRISARAAIIYGTVLGTAGLALIGVFANWLAFLIAGLAMFFYIVVYGIAKRKSVHGTVVGSLPGAAPPVIGYVSVSGHLDGAALLLFLIMVCWQMPHFYAIAIYRSADYRAAGLPVLPIKKGVLAAKKQMVFYICAFVVCLALLSLLGYAAWACLAVLGGAGLAWLKLALDGFKAKDNYRWAKRMFFYSLIVNLTFVIMIASSNLWSNL
jgi:heme o synthase